MKNLYNKLNKFNVNMELVDDIYYKGSFIDGIVIYFPNGETFQVFKDEENKYRFINENLAVILISDDINVGDWVDRLNKREVDVRNELLGYIYDEESDFYYFITPRWCRELKEDE